jgi:hypothetical protein
VARFVARFVAHFVAGVFSVKPGISKKIRESPNFTKNSQVDVVADPMVGDIDQ